METISIATDVRVVERGNRVLGDSLRVLLLNRGQGDWDLLLPQLFRNFCVTPHASTGETANILMLGRELQLPNLLMSNLSPRTYQAHSEYVQEMAERLVKAQMLLKE